MHVQFSESSQRNMTDNFPRTAVKCDRSCPQYEPTTEKHETLKPETGLFGEQPQDGASQTAWWMLFQRLKSWARGFSTPCLST